MQIGSSVCVCLCGCERVYVCDRLCDKISIFNEMEGDVGEGKVRGDARGHTRRHTHTYNTLNMRGHS